MAKLIPVAPFDLIIFGGAGDLAMRKLLPALFHRDRDGQIPPQSRIIATGRKAISRDAYLALVHTALAKSIGDTDADRAHWQQFAARLTYVELDARRPASWNELSGLLAEHTDRIRAIYLATPPDLFGPVAAGFRENALMLPDMRIVLEKPVGHDYASARDINDAVGACFPEQQIFRIDHYLGKETVQNLLALRFGNALFEPLWRREVVDHVQITVAEELGVGNRVGFYDDVGALRDMVQNHLMQLVCLVAMEPPASLDDDAVRDEKLKVLRSLRPMTTMDVRERTVRAQYRAGAIAGEAVPGYLDELGKPSDTETFVALKLDVENWRWSGVPFYLRTGKRLPVKHSEIVIQFKQVPHRVFDPASHDPIPNRLSILLQPDEGIKLRIMAKDPGPGGFNLRPVSLDLSFEQTFGVRYPDAYERLLIEVLRGNPALFMRRDEIETAWQWTDGILASWQDARQKMETYMAGSWGPTAAALLLDRDGRSWASEG
ncbi:MAG: glucose-6-phosphate dehydrogenase [Pseudomonadales bacterium]|nr:glucose-6-phosphate dehydrogenase [Pseudomonadales bacterium]MCP5184680.1 glucose-6-phosphate dehydrogenase [Pseudomonadales bacterium]